MSDCTAAGESLEGIDIATDEESVKSDDDCGCILEVRRDVERDADDRRYDFFDAPEKQREKPPPPQRESVEVQINCSEELLLKDDCCICPTIESNSDESLVECAESYDVKEFKCEDDCACTTQVDVDKSCLKDDILYTCDCEQCSKIDCGGIPPDSVKPPSLISICSSSDSSKTFDSANAWATCPCDDELNDGENQEECSCNDSDEEKEIAEQYDEHEKRPTSVEFTLALIKPEAIAHRVGIERIIIAEGFEICQRRWLHLTPEQVSDFYADCYGQITFPHLVCYMTSGTLIAMVLAKTSAIDDWRSLIGPVKVSEARLYYPDSIRARFGKRGGEDFENAVHGSVSPEKAEQEIHFFFPNFIVEPLMRDEQVENYLYKVMNKLLIQALAECCKKKPAEPVVWLANWLIRNNPNKPKYRAEGACEN